jgi:hypothetical protein
MRETLDREVAAARQALDEEAFSVARAKGRALTLELAIELALVETDHGVADT